MILAIKTLVAFFLLVILAGLIIGVLARLDRFSDTKAWTEEQERLRKQARPKHERF